MLAGCYLFILFLRTKSQLSQTKHRSREKSHSKWTDRTNIIHKNFIWKQLKISINEITVYRNCLLIIITLFRKQTSCKSIQQVSLSKNINRLMSEELLSNNRRLEKHFTPVGFEPLTSRSITKCTAHSAIRPSLLLYCNRLYISNNRYFGVRSIEITRQWRTKAWKSQLRSQRMF